MCSLFFRQPRWCRSNHSHYTTSVVVAATESDEGSRREFVTYCKRHPSTTGNIPSDSVELVHLNGEQTYGTMWKARPPPPSYTSGCSATSPCNLIRSAHPESLDGHFVDTIPTSTATHAQTVTPPSVSAGLPVPTEMHMIRVRGGNCITPNPIPSNESLQEVDVVKHSTSALSSFRAPRYMKSCDGAVESHDYERPAFVAISDGTGTLHCRPIASSAIFSGATNINPIS